MFARERELLASKPMQVKASRHPKIAIHRGVEVVEAHGTDALEALTVRWAGEGQPASPPHHSARATTPRLALSRRHLEAGTEERVPVWVR